MQFVVDTLMQKGKIFKNLQEIGVHELGIRNRIKIYKATDVKGYFWALFVVSQKSRFLMKDVAKLEEILELLRRYSEHNFKYKVLFIDAPLCSKAKEALKTHGWKLY